MQPVEALNPLLESALRYARFGWAIFPVYEPRDGRCSCGRECPSPAKHPRTPNGLLDATRNEAKIREWWGRWPEANIGISTGPSQLVVIDVDPRHGGDESFRILIQRNSALDTAQVLTGGGGEQYYLRATVDVASRSLAFGKDYPGIDIRGLGGYVVAPPSRHISGGTYEWEASSPRKFSDVPSWCAELLKHVERSPIPGADNDATIIAGERNEALARFAGRLRRLGTSVEAITDALLAMNARQVRPSLPEAEVRAIARSIGRYAPSEVPQHAEVAIGGTVEVIDIADIPDTDDSDTRRYAIGIENIDRHMGSIRPDDFVVLGARQGEGKTALLETLAITNATKFRVMFASLEMKIEDIRDRMIGRILRLTLDDVERFRKNKSVEYKQGRDSVDSLNLVFYAPEDPNLRTSTAVMEAAEHHEADILIVDYTRSLQDWVPGDTKTNSAIVQSFSRWSKRKNIGVVLASQLHRDAQGRRPLASQLQDTGRLEQEATKVLLLWRPFAGDKFNDNVCEVICAKNRRGPAFRGHVHWVGPTTSFFSMTSDEERAVLCCKPKGKKA